MIIAANVTQYQEVELARIYLNELTYIEKECDGRYFKNRVYICGANRGLHLRFESK